MFVCIYSISCLVNFTRSHNSRYHFDLHILSWIFIWIKLYFVILSRLFKFSNIKSILDIFVLYKLCRIRFVNISQSVKPNLSTFLNLVMFVWITKLSYHLFRLCLGMVRRWLICRLHSQINNVNMFVHLFRKWLAESLSNPMLVQHWVRHSWIMMQLSAIIMRSNIKRYCINVCRNPSRISIRFCVQKKKPNTSP